MFTTIKRFVLVLSILTTALATLAASPASAAPSSPKAAGRWADLQEHATRNGTVPVIVRMNVSTRPEHTLSTTARHSQRQKVASIRKGLLTELGHTPRNLKTADDMPLVAFSATNDDLVRLQ